jgi:Fic family protein
MAFVPQFTITARLLALSEAIAALRERIQSASVELSWVPALQKDSRSRNAHASTSIEGNPLTLEQVRAIEEGRQLAAADERSQREVLNYFAGLRHIEKHARKRLVNHEDIFTLHRILAEGVMDQGDAGRYRSIAVTVGGYRPPPPGDVSGLMMELLDWWNGASRDYSPVITSAVVHHRFESIHPFADGNGRTGRALSLWELYRRGFDTHHIFSVDEFYWEDRQRYYRELEAVHRAGDDLTSWLEYSAAGLHHTLERVWIRVQTFQPGPGKKLVLRPKQEQLLRLLADHGSMSPSEIWAALDISKQGAMDLINPLIDAGLVEKTGGKKTGRYSLRKP